mgnify:CR=1 FL=1
MAFDGFTIAALVSEMDAKLTGGHIQKLHSRRQTNFCFP